MHKTEKEIRQELEIIERAKRDPRDFAPLYESYYADIFRFVFKRVCEENITADIVSEVFQKAMLNLPKYKFTGKPLSSWLYRIALNETNQFFRKQKRTRHIDIQTAGIKPIIEMFDSQDDYEEQLRLVIYAIPELKEAEIQMLELRFFEQRSFKEVAEILNITENNAKVKTHRIIEKLRKKLQNLNTHNG